MALEDITDETRAIVANELHAWIKEAEVGLAKVSEWLQRVAPKGDSSKISAWVLGFNLLEMRRETLIEVWEMVARKDWPASE